MFYDITIVFECQWHCHIGQRIVVGRIAHRFWFGSVDCVWNLMEMTTQKWVNRRGLVHRTNSNARYLFPYIIIYMDSYEITIAEKGSLPLEYTANTYIRTQIQAYLYKSNSNHRSWKIFQC